MTIDDEVEPLDSQALSLITFYSRRDIPSNAAARERALAAWTKSHDVLWCTRCGLSYSYYSSKTLQPFRFSNGIGMTRYLYALCAACTNAVPRLATVSFFTGRFLEYQAQPECAYFDNFSHMDLRLALLEGPAPIPRSGVESLRAAGVYRRAVQNLLPSLDHLAG